MFHHTCHTFVLHLAVNGAKAGLGIAQKHCPHVLLYSQLSYIALFANTRPIHGGLRPTYIYLVEIIQACAQCPSDYINAIALESSFRINPVADVGNSVACERKIEKGANKINNKNLRSH